MVFVVRYLLDYHNIVLLRTQEVKVRHAVDSNVQAVHVRCQ